MICRATLSVCLCDLEWDRLGGGIDDCVSLVEPVCQSGSHGNILRYSQWYNKLAISLI